MPKEKFYYTGQTENDGQKPDLTIAWGNTGTTQINGTPFNDPGDTSGLQRLIRALRRAEQAVTKHGKQ